MSTEAPKLFIGTESSNMDEFVSPCCLASLHVATLLPLRPGPVQQLLSLEPLCQLVCGLCGHPVSPEKAIHGVTSRNVSE